MFSVKDIVAVKEGKTVCDGINLNFEGGQLTAVVGPNGAGKSSLIKAMLGEIPSTGSVLLGDSSFHGLSLTLRARQVAVLPQESNLAFPFTVREVLALGRLPHASGAAVDRAIVDEVASKLTLDDMLHVPYTRLSGGEKQRVNLARCLVQIWRSEDAQHRVLILDEPTSALDLSFQEQALKLVGTLVSQGISAVIVMHDLNLALRFCDRMVVMHSGRVVDEGAPQEVLSVDILQRVFQVDGSLVTQPNSHAPLLVLSS